jgi:hypothetical protein
MPLVHFKRIQQQNKTIVRGAISRLDMRVYWEINRNIFDAT